MKKLIITSIVFFVIAMTTSPMFAQQDAKLAQVGMAFLDIPVGTRAAAMGGAYVSVCDDANSMFWNPAGMALVTDREIIFNYNGWIADIKHYSGALAANIGNFGVFGVSVIMMDYGQITGTRVAANEAGYEII
ncbi:MAG: hypothetical protein GWN00_34470, partial [Aliifodinibius sp.]|nr:UPF0164 family protein [Fodinibius sp.]NIV15814.1 hypothetical protein [Fodinibius sp.]NIY29708.1 hypothetical protein [Fodinibius sp.]